MSKVTLNNITGGYAAVDLLNANFDAIEAAFDNTLSRNGAVPNAMSTDLDMDHNDFLNVGEINASSLILNGQSVTPGTLNYNGVVKETQTATSGQTVFNLTSITYSPLVNNLSVYVDGAYQNPSRYTETSATRVTFSEGLHVGAVVDFVVLSLNELSGTTSASNVTYQPAGSGAVATLVSTKLQETVSVKDFGALGNDDQTLYPTNYQTDNINGPVTITQQTADAIAINKAIVYLRSIGGGTLYIPKGTYRIYGYLEPIDFSIRIAGDGIDLSILKNCDASPTNVHGYGIFYVGPLTLSQITVENLTLDGNADVRTKPTAEFRSYPIAFYGYVNGYVNSIQSINSPIDCWYTAYANTTTSSMEVVNCTFDNSFRNTMSLVAGWNQTYTNCSVSGGGQVHGGTNPRYCLDIEPNTGADSIEKLAFSNCHFFNAINVIIGGTWGQALFDNCTIDAYGSTVPGYPWAFNMSQGQWDFSNCKINGDPDYLQTLCVHYNAFVSGAFQYTQYLKITGTSFYGCGFHGIGRKSFLQDCVFMNSRVPVFYESTASGRHEVYVYNLTLINVIDVYNTGAGTTSSFAIKNTTEGPVIVDGLNCIIDPESLPASPSFVSNIVYGIYLASAGLVTAEMKISNVQMSGYYQKYPDATSQAQNASYFRDWGSPNLPPANTAGQTAGPGAAYYANCTMYGNNP